MYHKVSVLTFMVVNELFSLYEVGVSLHYLNLVAWHPYFTR